MRKMLGILLIAALLSGCASRYETYILIEGSEERDSALSEPSPTVSDPNRNPVIKNQRHDDEQLVKRVLVDRKTGNIYYFQSIGGTLQVKRPSE